MKAKKRIPKVNEMKNESEQNKNELKASDSKTYRLKIEEWQKIFTESLTKTSGSVTEAFRLGFPSVFHFFSLKTTEIHSIEVRDP